jgi:hypothetical protein
VRSDGHDKVDDSIPDVCQVLAVVVMLYSTSMGTAAQIMLCNTSADSQTQTACSGTCSRDMCICLYNTCLALALLMRLAAFLMVVLRFSNVSIMFCCWIAQHDLVPSSQVFCLFQPLSSAWFGCDLRDDVEIVFAARGRCLHPQPAIGR